MTSVAVPHSRLSFDNDLRHCYSSVSSRLQTGSRSLDDVLEILRLRIDAETQFTNNLHKILGTSKKLMANLDSSETLRKCGIEALYTDLRNEYTQRMAFMGSLKVDVQQPLIAMKEFSASQNKAFQAQTKVNLKILKQHQGEFLKLKSKYDKVMTSDGNSRRSQLLTVKRKFLHQQTMWRQQQTQYEHKISNTLQSMEANEYKRMNALRDGFINWSAFITNLAANRSYDIKDLAESMACIDVEADLQCFMRRAIRMSGMPHGDDSESNGTPTAKPHYDLYGRVATASQVEEVKEAPLQRERSRSTRIMSTEFFQTYLKKRSSEQSMSLKDISDDASY